MDTGEYFFVKKNGTIIDSLRILRYVGVCSGGTGVHMISTNGTESVMDFVREHNDSALTADGLDDAIIGMASRIGLGPVVAYDWEKCVEILMDTNSWSYDEAVEWMDYNVTGAYTGEFTPVFIHRIEDAGYD